MKLTKPVVGWSLFAFGALLCSTGLSSNLVYPTVLGMFTLLASLIVGVTILGD